MRTRHMARSTEKTYVGWIRRFIFFHHVRHPLEMGKQEVEAFLTHLAVEGNVAESTQNQALAALLFLYREVLENEFGWLDDVVRAKKQRHVPVVLTPDEAAAVLARLEGVSWLIGKLLYGSGMRVMECLRLRIKDLDFCRMQVTVRETKGRADRYSLIPRTVAEPLQEHLRQVRKMHEHAMRQGYGGVELPHALERKYPNATYAWQWQYVFPAAGPSIDPRSGVRRRHHVYPTSFSRALKAAKNGEGHIGGDSDSFFSDRHMKKPRPTTRRVSVEEVGRGCAQHQNPP